MEPGPSSKSGYLQMHVQNTLAKKAPLTQTGKLGRGLIDVGKREGMDAYVAHLERQLAKVGATEDGAGAGRLQAIEAGLKQMEDKMAQCFDLLQGTQDFCEELARDTHARFEDAQSRVHRCERALRTAYQNMPRPDKLEALIRTLVSEEKRDTDRQLSELIHQRCRPLEEALFQGGEHLGTAGIAVLIRSGDDVTDTCGNRKQKGAGSGRNAKRVVNAGRKRGDQRARLLQGTGKLAFKEHPKNVADSEQEVMLRPSNCQHGTRTEKACGGDEGRCQHGYCGDSGSEPEAAGLEKRIKEAVNEALRHVALADRLASRASESVPAVTLSQSVVSTEEPTVPRAHSESPLPRRNEGRDLGGVPGRGMEGAEGNGTGRRTELQVEQRVEELAAAVAALQEGVGGVHDLRESVSAQAADNERLSGQLSELAATVNKFSGAIQQLASVEASVENLGGSIQRLASVEASVENLGGSIQRLTTLEDAIGRTTERVEQLSAANRQETEALVMEQAKTAAALRENADAVARLQARVDDVSTLLLDGTRVEHADIRQSAARPPSGLLAGPEVEEKGPDEKWVVDGKRRDAGAANIGLSTSPEGSRGLESFAELDDKGFREETAIREGFTAILDGCRESAHPLLESGFENQPATLEGSNNQGPVSGKPALRILEGATRMNEALATLFSKRLERSENFLDSEPGTHGGPSSNHRTQNAPSVPADTSLWVMQAKPPSTLVSPPLFGSSKGVTPDSSSLRFEGNCDDGKCPEDPGDRRSTESMTRSTVGVRHVDTVGQGWGCAEKEEGSAYARAVAKTEERKRRLDKLYRNLATPPGPFL